MEYKMPGMKTSNGAHSFIEWKGIHTKSNITNL
jgi:hypothetical protein